MEEKATGEWTEVWQCVVVPTRWNGCTRVPLTGLFKKTGLFYASKGEEPSGGYSGCNHERGQLLRVIPRYFECHVKRGTVLWTHLLTV